MSRNNDLPMLPPWLSDSEVTSGYEAPVQNLPQDDLIDEAPDRKRSKRRSPESRADGGRKEKKRRLWSGRGKDDAEAEDQPAERDSGQGWDQAPSRPDEHPSGPNSFGGPGAPQRPGGSRSGGGSFDPGAQPGVPPRPEGQVSGPHAVQPPGVPPQQFPGPNGYQGPGHTGESPGAFDRGAQWQQPGVPPRPHAGDGPHGEAAGGLPTRRPSEPSTAFQPLGQRPPVSQPPVDPAFPDPTEATTRVTRQRPDLPPPPAERGAAPERLPAPPSPHSGTPQSPADGRPPHAAPPHVDAAAERPGTRLSPSAEGAGSSASGEIPGAASPSAQAPNAAVSPPQRAAEGVNPLASSSAPGAAEVPPAARQAAPPAAPQDSAPATDRPSSAETGRPGDVQPTPSGESSSVSAARETGSASPPAADPDGPPPWLAGPGPTVQSPATSERASDGPPPWLGGGAAQPDSSLDSTEGEARPSGVPPRPPEPPTQGGATESAASAPNPLAPNVVPPIDATPAVSGDATPADAARRAQHRSPSPADPNQGRGAAIGGSPLPSGVTPAQPPSAASSAPPGTRGAAAPSASESSSAQAPGQTPVFQGPPPGGASAQQPGVPADSGSGGTGFATPGGTAQPPSGGRHRLPGETGPTAQDLAQGGPAPTVGPAAGGHRAPVSDQPAPGAVGRDPGVFTQPGAPSPTGPRPPEGSAPGGFPAPSGAENSGAPGGFAPAQGVHRAPVSDQPAPGELHRAPGVFSQGAPGQVGPVGGPVPGVAPSAQGGHRAPTSDPAPGAVRRDPGVFEQPGQQPPAGGPATQWGTGEYQQQGVAPAGHGPVPPQAAPSWNRGQHGQVPEGWGRPQHPQPQQMSGPPPSLDDVPMRRAKKAPGSGWRKAVHHVSGGAINPGMSAEERRLQELVARIRQPVRGDYRIAVLSLKGGVGKTTTTMGLGSIFASIRGDRVIAVDANPDFGTLSQRVPLQTRSTVRDLLLDPSIQRYSDVRRHTSQATSRLEVLASERDPAASEAFNDEEYRAVARILQRFYNIILTDCGTGLMHSAMAGVLDLAHSLVLISSAAIDGARSAAATLDWLSLHGHDHLVRNAVVVINLPREGSPNVGVQQLREYFLSRCRAVHIIPYDTHLSEGAEIDLHRLSKQAKRAYVELAATVADEFGVDHRHYHN